MGYPNILTDSVFVGYGGNTGSSTASQRTAAYSVAEEMAERAIGTFLIPTVVTGTFPWPYTGKILVLPHHHIIGIYSAVPKSPDCDESCDLLSGEACAYQQDDGGWGYLILKDITYLASVCCAGRSGSGPISVEIAYQAGLTTGSSTSPGMLLGLAKVAQIILNEIIDPGANEGGEGDPGVTSFSTQGHMEVRKGLGNTTLGNSAAANFANRMFSKFNPKRCLKLGW